MWGAKGGRMGGKRGGVKRGLVLQKGVGEPARTVHCGGGQHDSKGTARGDTPAGGGKKRGERIVTRGKDKYSTRKKS